jgi:hypothetical protein
MGNEGLPISLVVFILLVLITAIGFVGALSIVVMNHFLAATPAG